MFSNRLPALSASQTQREASKTVVILEE